MVEDKDVLTWLDKKVQTAQAAIQQFKSGNSLVDFRTIKGLSNDWQDIAKGVHVRVIYRSVSKIILRCKMSKGALLLIHAHPDYLERFRIKKGILVDKESNSILNVQNGKTFKLREYHTMLCVQEADMEIDCFLQSIN